MSDNIYSTGDEDDDLFADSSQSSKPASGPAAPGPGQMPSYLSEAFDRFAAENGVHISLINADFLDSMGSGNVASIENFISTVMQAAFVQTGFGWRDREEQIMFSLGSQSANVYEEDMKVVFLEQLIATYGRAIQAEYMLNGPIQTLCNAVIEVANEGTSADSPERAYDTNYARVAIPFAKDMLALEIDDLVAFLDKVFSMDHNAAYEESFTALHDFRQELNRDVSDYNDGEMHEYFHNISKIFYRAITTLQEVRKQRAETFA